MQQMNETKGSTGETKRFYPRQNAVQKYITAILAWEMQQREQFVEKEH